MNNSLIDFLENVYQKVNYWLSFAEAKNAALIAFNIAMLSFALNFSEYSMLLVVICSILLIISTTFCLLSFCPNLKHNVESDSANTTSDTKTDNANLIFWNDIAIFNSTTKYLNAIKSQYHLSSEGEKDDILINDLANEILVNSQIAMKKYKWFRRALMTDGGALIVLALLLIVA